MSDQPKDVQSWPEDPFPASEGWSMGGYGPWPFDPFEAETVPAEPPKREQAARPKKQGDLSELARGGLLNLGSVVFSVLLNFAFVLIVTRGMGVSLAGVFLEVIGLFLIVSNAAELGADAGLLRLIPRYRALRRTQDVRTMLHVGLWPTLVGGCLLGWAMFAFAPQLGSAFFQTNHATDPRAVSMIRILAFFVPLSGVSTVLIAGSRGFGAMLPTVTIENVVKPLFRALVAIAVVVLGLRASALAVGWGIPILAGLVAIIYLDRQYLLRAERRDRYDRNDMRSIKDLSAEFWRFSAPRGLVGAMSTTQFWLDTLLVGGMLSTSDAAIYTVSTRFLGVSVLVLAAVNLVIAPQISSLLSLGDRRRAENVYHTAIEWIMLSSWPPTLALATFAPLLLSMFGKQYVQGQTVLMILALGALGFLSTGPLITVLVMGGKSGWSLLNQVLSLATNIGLNLVLIPRYGITGAALAWGITGLVGQGSALIEVRLFLKLSPFHRRAALAAVGSTLIFGVGGVLVRLAFGATIPAFAGYLVLGMALYALFLWRFRHVFRLGELRKAFRDRRQGERRATLQPS